MKLPLKQEAIRARCFHPWGNFIEFFKEDVETSIPVRFEKIVSSYPDRVAVKADDRLWTFAELNCSANRLAQALLGVSGKWQEPVAVLLDHGVDIIISMLGIWKAGKIYVPLDPSLPAGGRKSILDESTAALILTDSRHNADALTTRENHRLIDVNDILDSSATNDIRKPVLADDLAYILFTSGSTGRPKGVVQNHRNLLNQIRKETNSQHICADDRLILLRSCSAIGGVRIVLSALLNGACVYPFDIKRGTYSQLADLLSLERITIYDSTPTVFRRFVGAMKDQKHAADLRLIRLSSEPAHKQDVELYKQNFPRSCILANSLGVTEAAGSIRLNLIDHDTTVASNTVPVGYPVEETEIELVNERGQAVGSGQIGEIVVRSRYLSVGYWNQPELTRNKFIVHSESSEEIAYLTGDLGKILSDGCLIHLGRKDFQIKIRGYKVDTAEIERTLMADESIKEVAITTRVNQRNEPSIIAYVVPSKKVAPTVSSLRRIIAAKFPEYMIPSSFVILDKLPMTPTGKVDRGALPVPKENRPWLDVAFVAPRSSNEKALVDIWQKVLHVDRIGIEDNFFDLGGNSLRLAEVSRNIELVFGKEIALAEMLRFPTVRLLAESLISLGKQDSQRKGRSRASTRRTLRQRRKQRT